MNGNGVDYRVGVYLVEVRRVVRVKDPDAGGTQMFGQRGHLAVGAADGKARFLVSRASDETLIPPDPDEIKRTAARKHTPGFRRAVMSVRNRHDKLPF